MDFLEFYRQHGVMTDPGPYAHLLQELPADLPALVQAVQGLLLHVFWAERYGLQLADERRQEVNLRKVSRQLARIWQLSGAPLREPRPLGQRLIGNCRDFAVLLTACLRHQGVPARARCGFGAYFEPGLYEDHWVCEVWDAARPGWLLVDAQLDALQRQVLQIGFDPLDVPRDQFLVGGRAWQMARSGKADPELFGIFDMHGLWFIRGDLVRDFVSLNKVEILPWDVWGLMPKDEADVSAEDLALLDRLATLCLAGDEAFGEIRSLYEGDDRLCMPAGWPGD